MNKVLGLIPARGGSKGVLRKNLRLVGGLPLIAHTIREAKKSDFLTQLIVSTEDKEIAQASEKEGALVLKRPESLAQDESSALSVALHVLDSEEKNGQTYDILVLLQPTAPLRTFKDINQGIILLNQNPEAPAVISVEAVEDYHPARMYTMGDHQILKSYDSKLEDLRRQDLPKVYHRNGAVYAIRPFVLKKERTFFPKNSLAHVMPKSRSLNIDDEFDLKLIDLLLTHTKESQP